jgi:leucyl-tRNA synthetase
MTYDFRAIEARWQRFWDEHQTFRADVDPERPKYYVLDMFPYPSGDGLHVGHPEGYTATDIVARYKRMRGYNVLHPMGWDAFGLPAERYAMKHGVHPAVRTAECIRNFKRQLKTLGFSYDWAREVDTTDPNYYKWTQWIFLQIWGAWYDAEQGRARPIAELPIPAEISAQGPAAVRRYRDERRLAYLHDAPVNWCPALRVVLANEEVAEQVELGHEVVRRPMRQWMMRITAYAERLLLDLEGLEWPASVLDMQKHWIGRSDGAEVEFTVADADAEGRSITVFTTRPDTLFGATYMVLAPEHPLVGKITAAAQRAAVQTYVDAAARRSERERQAEAAEGQKTGVFTGAHAVNPANGQRVPVWISDYVLMGYGTGAIMAVPGHDERDHAFAQAMGLPIVEVVSGAERPIAEAAHTGPGLSINSGFLDGLATDQAKERMITWLEQQGRGRRRVTYKLRDWLFSRQRYWGEPFPLLHRPDGEVAAIPESELPVTLPPLDDFQPSESGEPPLSKATAWRELPDGSLRETNTMPQWAGSCWYYLRFMDPSNDAAPFSKAAADYWLPVDLYIGGAEHAVLHLLYARFWHKVLFDLGHVGTREPFQRLVNQGMVLGATYYPRQRGAGSLEGFKPDEVEPLAQGSDQWIHKLTREPVDIKWDKMSKSRGNVVNPDDVIGQYGADTMRLYEMFMGPLEHSAPWQTEGVAGCHRFLQRVYRLAFETSDDPAVADRLRELPAGEGSDRQRRLLHRTIHAVSERIDRLAFNTAISAMMVFVRDIVAEGEPLHRDTLAQFCLILAPFAPHLAEEIWGAIGQRQSLAHELWPAADEALLIDATFPLVVQIQGKRRAELAIPQGASEDDIKTTALAHPDVQRHLDGKTPRRVIYVPGKLLNIVL